MPRNRSRRPPILTLARRWSAILVVLAVGYFYYHPLRAYFSTRSELGSRRAEVSRLEASGGVERWTRAARDEPALHASLMWADAEQRRLRPELSVGIGGSQTGAGTLKCLHAHVAFALARGGYELGDRIASELEP